MVLLTSWIHNTRVSNYFMSQPIVRITASMLEQLRNLSHFPKDQPWLPRESTEMGGSA